MWIEAKNIEPGSTVDIDPNKPYITDANRAIVECEYVVVDSVNGGWADNAAAPGEVVIYSASNLGEPIILPAHEEVWLIARPNETVEEDAAPAYYRDEWESEEEFPPGRPDTYFITVYNPDGEEYATIIHRTVDGKYPLDGEVAKRKEQRADHIVAALNAYNAEHLN